MRISDWSSDVCSSDLGAGGRRCVGGAGQRVGADHLGAAARGAGIAFGLVECIEDQRRIGGFGEGLHRKDAAGLVRSLALRQDEHGQIGGFGTRPADARSEENKSELQCLIRNSYYLFFLHKKITEKQVV